MLYNISKDVAADLDARKFPWRVGYGPSPEVSLNDPRVIFERLRGRGSDSSDDSLSRPRNPTMISTRHLGGKITIYAKSNAEGARVIEHERDMDKMVDMVTTSLHKVAQTRRNPLTIVSMGTLSEDDLEARGITTWSGVAYEILFTVGRGVTVTDWEQAAAPEATIGPGGVGIVTEAEILPTNAPDGTLPVDVC